MGPGPHLEQRATLGRSFTRPQPRPIFPSAMPSEYPNIVTDGHYQQRHESVQLKACTICHTLLDTTVLSVPRMETSVCAACLQPPDHVSSPSDTRYLRIDIDLTMADGTGTAVEDDRVHLPRGSYQSAAPEPLSIAIPKVRKSPIPLKSASLPASAFNKPFSSILPSQTNSHPTSSTTIVSPSTSTVRPPYSSPHTDITRLRVKHQNHHCLYPGSTFSGTQKSGKNSYEVNVTIVVRIPGI